jgi:hypothetical protein
MRLFFIADFCYYDKSLGITKQLFNPYEESLELLVAWLHYRYVYPVTTWDKQYLAELVLEDMRDHGNNPAFMDFVDFLPDQASRSFLATWLSWYGVTTTEEKPQSWWANLARKILDRHTQRKTSGFDKLISTYNEQYKTEAVFLCVAASLELIPETAFIEVLKPHIESEVKQHFLYKQILAKILGVSAVAVPLLVNVAISHKAGHYTTWENFKNSVFSSKNAITLVAATTPLVLTYLANDINENTISKEMRNAVLKDIIAQRPIPESTLRQLVGDKGIWSDLFSIVFLPMMVSSLAASAVA